MNRELRPLVGVNIADINLVTNRGIKTLGLAARYGYLNVIKLLSIYLTSTMYKYLLKSAIKGRQHETILYLVDNDKSRCDIVAAQGLAAKFDYPRLFEHLLSVHMRSVNDIIEIATENQSLEVIDMLVTKYNSLQRIKSLAIRTDKTRVLGQLLKRHITQIYDDDFILAIDHKSFASVKMLSQFCIPSPKVIEKGLNSRMRSIHDYFNTL
jgi:hypothetical protein